MKYFVDANVSYKLYIWLKKNGYDATHTDLQEAKEKTSDTTIRFIADSENRVVISKDSDFYYTCLLNNSPKKLLFISTGNIVNTQLFILFEKNFEQINSLFENHDLIELDNTSIIIHNK